MKLINITEIYNIKNNLFTNIVWKYLYYVHYLWEQFILNLYFLSGFVKCFKIKLIFVCNNIMYEYTDESLVIIFIYMITSRGVPRISYVGRYNCNETFIQWTFIWKTLSKMNVFIKPWHFYSKTFLFNKLNF